MEVEYGRSNNVVYTERLIADFAKFESSLTQLFRATMDSTDRWEKQGPSDDFETLFYKIKKADTEQAFNPDQTKRIMLILLNVFASLNDQDAQNASLDFLMKHIDIDTAYDCLKIAKDLKNEVHITACLDYIANETGLIIIRNKDSLFIELQSYTNDAYQDILTNLPSLFAIYDDISFKLNPSFLMEVETLEKLMSDYGKCIESLDLTDLVFVLDDDFAEKIIISCPNLSHLSMSSEEITDTGLAKLNTLSKLITLNLAGCSDLRTLPDISNLTILEDLTLYGCEGLTDLPNLESLTHLKTINLTNCSINQLPSFKTLTNLTHLYLEGLGSLLKLDLSPFVNLEVVNLEGCWNLNSLMGFTHLKNFKEMNLKGCGSLTTPLDLQHLTNLEKLNLEGCSGLSELSEITHLPHLKELHLLGCVGLSDQYRLSILSSLVERDFFHWVYKTKHFGINPENIKRLVALTTEKKLLDQTTPPEMQLSLAKFIIDFFTRYQFSNRSVNIANNYLSANSVKGKKNPIDLFNELKELSRQNVNFKPPSMIIDGIEVALNMNFLMSMSKTLKIKREDLPANVTLESFDQLFNNLQKKFQNGGQFAIDALRLLGTNWATIQMPISGDPEQLLRGLLRLSGENVHEDEAKWRAVLSNILDQDSTKKTNSFFTEQEELFIKTMMGIQNCRGGKSAGIASSYEWLSHEKRYKTNLSKAMSPMEMETEEKKIKAIEFIREFIANQPVNTPIEVIATRFVESVNGESSNQKINIVPWLIEEDPFNPIFWDEEDGISLIDHGALELLKIEKQESAKSLFSEIILQTVQKLMESQFSGTNALMKELTNSENISQASHQAIYLKNLIGHLVGVSLDVTFDWYTGVLNENLINKDQEDVLALFFQHVTAELIVSELIKTLNKTAIEKKDALKSFLPDDKYWDSKDEGILSKRGALELLMILEVVSFT